MALAAPSGATAQTILSRARLGNNTEDVAFVGTGPLASHVAILDGYEVLAVPGEGRGGTPVRKLFDIRDLDLEAGPLGMAYIDSEHLFAFVDPVRPMKLVLSDHRGEPRGSWAIQHVGGAPDVVGGLAYVPPTAERFPGHLVMTALRFLDESRSSLEVLSLDGEVVAEIVPNLPEGSELGEVAFVPPNRLLVTTIDDTIWTLDFHGNVVAPPTTVPGIAGLEGLAQLRDGRFVAATYNGGTLFFLDEGLNRRPDSDRDYRIGSGLTLPVGAAWNADTNEHLVAYLGGIPQLPAVAALAPSLDAARPVVDLVPQFVFPTSTAYLPDEHLIAVTSASFERPFIALFDERGNLVEQVDPQVFSPTGRKLRPQTVEYIPTTRQFAIHVNGQPRVLYIVSRTGALVRSINLSLSGITQIRSVTYFDPEHPSGGRFLIVESSLTDRVLVTDFDGNPLSEFDYRDELGLLSARDGAAITTGSQAGAFTMLDAANSEIVVFRLD